MESISMVDFFRDYCVIKTKDGTRKPTQEEIDTCKMYEELYKNLKGENVIILKGRIKTTFLLKKP